MTTIFLENILRRWKKLYKNEKFDAEKLNGMKWRREDLSNFEYLNKDVSKMGEKPI